MRSAAGHALDIGHQSTPPLRRGDEIEIRAESAAFEGGCIGRHDGMAVFLEACVPGDLVRARVFQSRRRHARARAIQVIEPSPDRVDALCDYFGLCGGCAWQNLNYEQQLRWKRRHVVDAMERIGGLVNIDVSETLPCQNRYFYRNKMEFSFGASRWMTAEEMDLDPPPRNDFALGLHIPARFDKVLDIEHCLLQSDVSSRIVNATRRFALDNDLPSYSTRTHTGLLRHLVIRTSVWSGETMAILVTSEAVPETMNRFAEMLRQEVPEVTTLVQGVHRGKAQVSFTQELLTLYGEGTITEKIGGNLFTISPFSFFQTNTIQGERLYERALGAAQLTGAESVWDLYCGAGTITLAAARHANQILGAEINAGSVEDARRNAERNGIGNVRFIAGDLRHLIDHASELFVPDVVITDPPRAGMHEEVVRALLRLAPRRISYVSCNPATQARDLAILSESYAVERIEPVDMFPQTNHIETVATLVLR